MKEIIFIVFAALSLGSCNQSSTSGKTETSSPQAYSSSGNLFMDIAGSYSDTLPCADCIGIMTELIIKPDTTFILRERFLGADGRPMKSTSVKGVYTLTEDQNKLKLNSSSPDFAMRTYEIGKNSLIATDGTSGTGGQFDLSLDLSEKTINKVGSDYVMYRTKPFVSFPVHVFNFITGNDIHIYKAYLDATSEAEKAIIAYYAVQYNNGCDQDGCALLKAMNLDMTSATALVNKWIPTAKLGTEDENRESRSKGQLAMVFFIKTKEGIQVNYNVSNDMRQMASGSDEFKIGDSEVTVAKKGTLVMQAKAGSNKVIKESVKRDISKRDSPVK